MRETINDELKIKDIDTMAIKNNKEAILKDYRKG